MYVNTDVMHIMQRIIERSMFLLQENCYYKTTYCKPFNFETEAVLTLLWSNLPSICHYYLVPPGNLYFVIAIIKTRACNFSK